MTHERPLKDQLESWSEYTGSPLGKKAKAEIERLEIELAAQREIVANLTKTIKQLQGSRT